MFSYIYPEKCVCCGSILPDRACLCEKCLPSMHKIGDARCKYCGRDSLFCSCTANTFRFDRNVSVFRYDDGACNVIKRYKFRKITQLAVYISRKMSMVICEEYKNIAFDFICFVPSSLLRRLKRGFNPAELIARKISKELQLPVYDYVRRKPGLRQQKASGYKQRLENVRDKFYVKSDLTGKRVLLIDDVITTGATLNDCARALKAAGAKSVCCATFAATYKK